MKRDAKLAILGAGNIGSALADGLLRAGYTDPAGLILTRRNLNRLERFGGLGCRTTTANADAAGQAEVLIIAVEPRQIDTLIDEIAPSIDPDRHLLISVVTGVTIAQIAARVRKPARIVRAMPNTAVAIGQSMTCLAANTEDPDVRSQAEGIFRTVGEALFIKEDDMTAATALGACGLAFFLRAIRAASQGGIEIGFHADKALFIAAQTAKGAASLLLQNEQHPEFEIDKVTTPRGVTISGLNQMEHAGFSSAMIKGIVTSWSIATSLYKDDQKSHS